MGRVGDQFRLVGGGGGGGGGGAEVYCLNIFSIACPNIKWFCPNNIMAIWKIIGCMGPRTLVDKIDWVNKQETNSKVIGIRDQLFFFFFWGGGQSWVIDF